MFEVRFHGRGGQGAVMAAQTFAEAAVLEGHHAQAFPYFGAERRGAPVRAFARVDDKRITIKSQIYEPDMLVIMDESLLDIDPVADGLKSTGSVVMNTVKAPQDVDIGVVVRCATVDAIPIALETIKAPIVNTAILGSVAKICDLVTLDSIKKSINDRFGEKLGEQAARMNSLAAEMAYARTVVGICKGDRAIVRPKAWLPTWQQLPQGTALGEDTLSGVSIGPGGSLGNYTGTWRTITPKYDREKCVRCLRCWFCCPEGCIKRLEDDHVKWDYRYCKGCGICANICPADAIHMVKGAIEP
jgi:pyruvate ferredoxin oxidoreductase gamma subunit